MPACVWDINPINVFIGGPPVVYESAFPTLTIKGIEDDTESCLPCMFQSDVSGHRLQSCKLYNDGHCRKVSQREIEKVLILQPI